MKLENRFMPGIALALMLSNIGCKRLDSFDSFIQKLSSSKGFVAVYQFDNTKVEVKLSKLASGPKESFRRLSVQTPKAWLKVNEKQGSLEVNDLTKEYFEFPETRQFGMGTGKVFPNQFIQAGPLIGFSPDRLNPKKKWSKKTESGSIDRWETKVESPSGLIPLVFKVDQSGNPVEFSAGNDRYKVVSFTWDDNLPEADFKWQIPDQLTPFSKAFEMGHLSVGLPWPKGKFDAVGGWSATGTTQLYALIDPEDDLSKKLMSWLEGDGKELNANFVAIGGLQKGLHTKSESEFYELVGATPTLVLVGKDGNIVWMWQGFDLAKSEKMKKEIIQMMLESS